MWHDIYLESRRKMSSHVFTWKMSSQSWVMSQLYIVTLLDIFLESRRKMSSHVCIMDSWVMSQLYIRYVTWHFSWVTQENVKSRMHKWLMSHDSFICETSLTYMWSMTHAYVRCDSLIRDLTFFGGIYEDEKVTSQTLSHVSLARLGHMWDSLKHESCLTCDVSRLIVWRCCW